MTVGRPDVDDVERGAGRLGHGGGRLNHAYAEHVARAIVQIGIHGRHDDRFAFGVPVRDKPDRARTATHQLTVGGTNRCRRGLVNAMRPQQDIGAPGHRRLHQHRGDVAFKQGGGDRRAHPLRQRRGVSEAVLHLLAQQTCKIRRVRRVPRQRHQHVHQPQRAPGGLRQVKRPRQRGASIGRRVEMDQDAPGSKRGGSCHDEPPLPV